MPAFEPTILLSDMLPLRSKPIIQGEIITYPRHWQVPAATEKVACEAIMARAEQENAELDFEYIGFPWATVIDGVRRESETVDELLRALVAVRGFHAGGATRRATLRRATVGQHINADQFVEVFRACGVTDLFWSHARHSQREIGGVAVHPFPLFPAQTPGEPEHRDLHRPRRYLANFIGAYNPKVYLTDVRAHIFGDAGAAADLLIIKREEWHFERAVYAEQMKGIAPDNARLKLEALHKEEYLQAIRDSVFTLCPTGSGPNSIRVGEALALGSIPIILTRELALPGDAALWERACLFEEDSAAGYRQALSRARAMPAAELKARQLATRDLFGQIGPHAYAELIIAAMTGKRAAKNAPHFDVDANSAALGLRAEVR